MGTGQAVILNPYESVNWGTVQYVGSVTHAHSRNADRTMNLVNSCVPSIGPKALICVSNYHGSYPTWPLDDLKLVDYNERREYARYGGDEEDLERDPANYVPTRLSAYEAALDYAKAAYCPNAEHHRFRVNGNDPQVQNRWHMNSIGSTWGSGHSRLDEPDLGNGAEIEWTDALDNMIDGLLYEECGGVTINHPNWSGDHLPYSRILETLDYSRYVLGIEIYNDSSERQNTGEPKGWDLVLWDRILSTGRRCWGFAAPDHAHEVTYPDSWLGACVLLVDDFDIRTCLKAFYDGSFYSKIDPRTELKFTNIQAGNGSISATAYGASRVEAVIDGAQVESDSASISVDIDDVETYVRFAAYGEDGNDIIFSNPITVGEGLTRRRPRILLLD